KDTLDEAAGRQAGSSMSWKQPSGLLGYLIVRQRRAIEKTRGVGKRALSAGSGRRSLRQHLRPKLAPIARLALRRASTRRHRVARRFRFVDRPGKPRRATPAHDTAQACFPPK